jgi:hypothetical protein
MHALGVVGMTACRCPASTLSDWGADVANRGQIAHPLVSEKVREMI